MLKIINYKIISFILNVLLTVTLILELIDGSRLLVILLLVGGAFFPRKNTQSKRIFELDLFIYFTLMLLMLYPADSFVVNNKVLFIITSWIAFGVSLVERKGGKGTLPQRKK